MPPMCNSVNVRLATIRRSGFNRNQYQLIVTQTVVDYWINLIFFWETFVEVGWDSLNGNKIFTAPENSLLAACLYKS